jgi:hypothetical protein
VVEAQIGEDPQRVLPVFPGPLVLFESVVGTGEPVVGAGLVDGLRQLARQRQSPAVVADGGSRIAGGVLLLAEALVRLEFVVAAADLPGQPEKSLVVVGSLLMASLFPVKFAEAGQHDQLAVAVTGGSRDPQRLAVVLGRCRGPSQQPLHAAQAVQGPQLTGLVAG